METPAGSRGRSVVRKGASVALIGLLFGVVMFTSRGGLLHVGFASPALSPSATLDNYGYTTVLLVTALAAAVFLYVVWVLVMGPKGTPRVDAGVLAGSLGLLAFGP
jgi:hypothetical protein